MMMPVSIWVSIMPTDKCPRCGSLAHYVLESDEVALQCRHCGHLSWFKRETNEGMVIERKLPKDDTPARLPVQGTRLHRCLIFLADCGTATTGQVAEALCLDARGVANSFAVLSARNLVKTLEYNRGKKGGSTWGLTSQALALLGE
jgi:hypothetical protein